MTPSPRRDARAGRAEAPELFLLHFFASHLDTAPEPSQTYSEAACTIPGPPLLLASSIALKISFEKARPPSDSGAPFLGPPGAMASPPDDDMYALEPYETTSEQLDGWTEEEDTRLRGAVVEVGDVRDWKAISEIVGSKNAKL